MQTKPRIQNPLLVTQRLFYLNAAVWVLLGILTLWSMNASGSIDAIGAIMIGMLMFGNAFILALAGVGLAERTRLTYLFAVLILVVNILLTFTDQVGWLVELTLLLDLAILALLVIYRRQLWAREPC